MATDKPRKPGGKRPSGESSFRKSSGPAGRSGSKSGDSAGPRKPAGEGRSPRPAGGGARFGTGSRPNRISDKPSRGPRPGADFNEYSEESYRALERGETGSERPARSSRDGGKFSKPGAGRGSFDRKPARTGEGGERSDDRRPARKKPADDFSTAPRRPTGYKSRTDKTEDRPRTSSGRGERSSDDRPKSFSRGERSDDRKSYGREERPSGERPKFGRSSDRSDDRPRSYTRKTDSDAGDERPKRGRSSEGEDSGSGEGFRGRSDRSFDRSDRKPSGYKGASDRNDRPERPTRSTREDRDRDDERPARRSSSRDAESDENRPVKPYNREGRESSDRPARSGDRPERSKASFGVSSERPVKRAAKPREDSEGDEPRFAAKKSDRFEKTGTKGKFEKGKKKVVERDEPPTYNLRKFESKTDPGNEKIRLNRYIANSGVCSRREADELIAAGEIKVNGVVVTEMGHLVTPEDSVQYGKKILNREKLVYVLLNKPKGFITTTEDPEERRTVMELVANASKERIFPVGRLDRNTTGLLLFTNDGELAQKLSHPSHTTSKVYQLELDKAISEEHIEEIKAGLELEDGKVEIDDIAILAPDRMALGIELHIGRNRIVRRIFEHLGYEVIKLDRVAYAGLTKKDLARGQWRFLDEKEVIRLKYFD